MKKDNGKLKSHIRLPSNNGLRARDFSVMRKTSSFLCAALLAVSAMTSDAAVLLQYTFTGYVSADDAPYAASTIISGVTAGGFTPAAGLGTNGNWNTSANGISTTTGNPTPSFAQKPQATSATQAAAFTNNAYWSITLAPDGGNAVSLTSLTFDLDTFNTGLLPSFYLASSVGGYSTPIGVVYTNQADAAITVDLSGVQFQNLTANTEFRLYLWSENGGGGSGSRWEFDNVTVNGSVAAIPEPSTLVLLGLCGVFLMANRSSRRLGLLSE